MLTFLQVSKILNIQPSQLMEWVDASLVPSVHKSNAYYFSEHEITKLLEIREMVNTRKMTIEEVRQVLPIEQPKNVSLTDVIKGLQNVNTELARIQKKNDEMKELILHFIAQN